MTEMSDSSLAHWMTILSDLTLWSSCQACISDVFSSCAFATLKLQQLNIRTYTASKHCKNQFSELADYLDTTSFIESYETSEFNNSTTITAIFSRLH